MTEETSTAQVPLLDLAPKLKRPLSLLNPLDYLRLLYWVFYFPQAITWYVETYCESKTESNKLSLRQRWELVQKIPLKRQLALMGIFLAIFFPVLYSLLLESIGIPMLWKDLFVNLYVSVLFGWFFVEFRGVAFGVAFGVVLSLTFTLTFTTMKLFLSGITFFLFRSLLGGVLLGVPIGLAVGVTQDGWRSVIGSVTGCIATVPILGLLLGIWISMTDSIPIGVLSSLLLGIAFSVAFVLAIFRIDNKWVSLKSIPRITPLMIPRIYRQLSIWLEADWERGLMNANQLLKYSLQFVTVNAAINNVLGNTPNEKIFLRIATLTDLIGDWDILSFSSASFSASLKSKFIEGIFWLPYRSWISDRWGANYNLRFEKPYQTVAASFFFLRQASETVATKVDSSTLLKMSYAYAEKQENCSLSLKNAAEILQRLRNIKYGEEIYQLVCTLRDFIDIRSIEDLLKLKPICFPNSPELRPTTWVFLKKLESVVKDVHVLSQAASRTARSYALNRCFGQISEILNALEELVVLKRKGCRKISR